MSLFQRGLSLVEICIVMALIAVLMALSLPMLSNANAEARATVCRQNLADIGNAISGYTRDYGALPSIAELPPHHPGLSLPELVAPRLQTPNILFCPSDETERSQLLGTSYRWSPAFNGMAYADLHKAIDKPVLTDRDAFHTGSELAANELLLKRAENSFQFVVTSGAGAPLQEPAPIVEQDVTDPAGTDQELRRRPSLRSLFAKHFNAARNRRMQQVGVREHR